MPPITLSSIFLKPAPDEIGPHSYGRIGNPSREALERAVAELEGAAHGLAFPSGVAAITAVLQTLRPGDHLVTADDLYGGTVRLLEGYLPRHGASFTAAPLADEEALHAAFTPKTRYLWIESPSNPMLNVASLRRMADIAHRHGAQLVVDNTFMSPALQRPLAHGADIVLHSATKYLNGHSDAIAGLVLCTDDALGQELRFLQTACGAVLPPFDSYLVLRGLKTLALRMAAHEHNCLCIAEALTGHPQLRRVIYPGHPSHPGYETHKAQASGGGGVLTLELDGGVDEVRRFMKALRLFTTAESLGGVESLVGHPATSSHQGVAPAERERLGIRDGVVRLSVGIEDADDLIDDLTQALRATFS